MYSLTFYLAIYSFGLLKSQALRDSSKAEDLLAKCSGKQKKSSIIYQSMTCWCGAVLEALCAQKDEELGSKEQVIEKLQFRLKAVEESYRQEMMEVQVQAQQDAYIASHLGLQEARKSRGKKQQRKR